ncbi:hypothetical protein [Paenibacillus thiaminolyticus]|uniref:Uncharacterized protein n=1 Tax=Paenibacillus thiaminolyticus TaxID=49283 RepID=A0A3A3GFA0_PANTH|nr:hypothetical protein [Paenibacillus thiaminolyticus]RJG21440.1 hypothetical protein DQX05_21445 [Paenibacillus thiaminolyticus]
MNDLNASQSEGRAFSKNTGLSLEDAVDLKTYLFLTDHVNLPDTKNGKYYYKGYFHPDMHVAYGWEKALKAELSPVEKAWFEQLKVHELAESKMMRCKKECRIVKLNRGNQ